MSRVAYLCGKCLEPISFVFDCTTEPITPQHTICFKCKEVDTFIPMEIKSGKGSETT